MKNSEDYVDVDVDEVSPLQAKRKLDSKKSAVLLDVRSKLEYDYVGHPIGAINVPWQSPPNWELNPAFLEEVVDALKVRFPDAVPEEVAVFAMCRSGKRSFDAATYLKESGFTQVVNIAEGFEGDLDANKHRGNTNGWRFHSLPWEQT